MAVKSKTKSKAKVSETIAGIIAGAQFNNAVSILLADTDAEFDTIEEFIDGVKELTVQLVEAAVEVQLEVVSEFGDPKAGGTSRSTGRSGTSSKRGSSSKSSSKGKGSGTVKTLSEGRVDFYNQLLEAIEDRGGDVDDLTYPSVEDFEEALPLSQSKVQAAFDEAIEMRDDLED